MQEWVPKATFIGYIYTRENCTWAGHSIWGLHGSHPSPRHSAVVPLQSTQITVSDAHFWVVLQMEEGNYWLPWACNPQTYWRLRYDVNPCDTALLRHHQPIRELCTSWSHTLRSHSLILPLKMLCWGQLGGSGLLSTSRPGLLAWCSTGNTALIFTSTQSQ